MSAPVKATVWFALCSFLQRAISMITTPFYTRLLPADEYGLTSAYTAWEMVLFMMSSLCLYKSLMNLYVKRNYAERDGVLSSVISLGLIITLAWLGLFIAFQNIISSLMGLPKTLCFFLFLSFVFNSAIQCWNVHQRYAYNYKRVVVFTIMMTSASAVLGLIFVIFVARTAVSKIGPYVLVMCVLGLFVYFDSYRRGRVFFDKDNWIFAVSFCAPLLPHYLSEFVLQSSDKIMINNMCGSKDVALYSVAYSVGGILSMITFALDSSFAPFEYEAIKEKKYKELTKVSTGVLLLVAAFILLIILFAREIVLVFGGYRYEESIYVIAPISIGLFFNYEFRLYARVQEYYEHKKTIVIPSILAAILNILLNYYAIRVYGYKAAAYTTLMCYLFFCIIHYFFYKKTCADDNKGIMLYDSKSIMGISCAVIIGGLIAYLLSYNIIVKYVLICILLIVFAFQRSGIQKYIKDISEAMK